MHSWGTSPQSSNIRSGFAQTRRSRLARGNMDDSEALKRRIQELDHELVTARQKIAELERTRSTAGADEFNVPISEFEETLRRLVQRTAMIVQAEKCVIMVRDRETGDLVARSP